MKICSHCKLELSLDRFPKRGAVCWKCRYIASNKKKANERKREYDKKLRQKLESDPVLKEQYLEKNRKRRKKRKENGEFKKYIESSPRTWLYQRMLKSRYHANKRGLAFNLDLDHLSRLWEQQVGKCALSGLNMTHRTRCLYSASPDRIDSNKGYVKDNVQIVCKFINLAKNNHSNREMQEWIKSARRTEHDQLN